MGNRKIFGELQRSNLPDQIEATIKEAIFSGKLKPGDRINEVALAEEMKVSRVPIREALRRLEQQGLVTSRVNKGVYVTKLNLQDIKEMFSMREILEPYAARLAVQNMQPSDLAALQELVDKMKASARANDPIEFFRHDIQFHKHIWRLTNNKLLERTLLNMCEIYFAFIVGIYDSMPLDLVERARRHEKILNTFRKRDPKAAQDFTSEIISTFGKKLIRDYKLIQDKSVLGVSEEG